MKVTLPIMILALNSVSVSAMIPIEQQIGYQSPLAIEGMQKISDLSNIVYININDIHNDYI
ncbi:hypothetical protein E5N05_13035, partial [Photobacterium sp. CAIM 1938]|uniref:hypothetical protein n=1 Tax=Photobacterium lucens TaxID=2562949 RepID=UPI00136D8F86